MTRYTLPVTHRPTRDGQRVTHTHVPFFLAHEVVSHAWAMTLEGTRMDGDAMEDMAVVHVDSDFHHEVFIGEVTADVTLERIGTSSLTLVTELSQNDRPVARVTVVLAHVDPDRTYSVPLPTSRRIALEKLMKTPA
jgi:acyl-CoA thioesterase FadM